MYINMFKVFYFTSIASLFFYGWLVGRGAQCLHRVPMHHQWKITWLCPQHKLPQTLILVLIQQIPYSHWPQLCWVLIFALFVFDTKLYFHSWSSMLQATFSMECFHFFVLSHLTFFDTGVLTLTINIHTSINITWQSSLRHIQAWIEVFQSTTKHNGSLFYGSLHCNTLYLHHV